MPPPRVLGVDACSQGWVGLVLTGRYAGAYLAPHIQQLVTAAEADGPLDVVAVDMPIGLPDTGKREADLLARREIGSLWTSVFLTPVRAALKHTNYAEALEASRTVAQMGISRQAFALRTKLLEVDQWVRDARCRVVEVHPEVSFAALAGEPLTVRKKTWAGMVRRRRLLEAAGIMLPADLGSAGGAGADDVVDAAAAAWSARRVACGQAWSLPSTPEVFGGGLPAAIWC